MRVAMLALTLFAAQSVPTSAHEYGQNTDRVDTSRFTGLRSAPERNVNNEEGHPEITALVDRTGPCVEFRVRASRRNSGSEAKHIEKCH
ncbi:hypothetical protein [Rhodoplanes sp. Z2-YC6860]|uniref:hypothetical protein n=1 Tax=Rhodoplanes sp. Z2-YC6860 TaxID=674703 RepID=UPI00082A1AA7|nr:hypothetical protein [Rhodoplanes sp. Z2-YC6860]